MRELIATIDVGTNTAHLLLSYALADGSIAPIRTETRYVRLGQGVDASGEAHADALVRLRDTLVLFVDMARRAGAEKIVAMGTSASRDIRNREGLVALVREHAGIDYQIITGEEEALLTSLGAVSYLDLDPDVNTVVVDIGGGSTELTYTRRDDGTMTLETLASLDLGSVRLTERCFEQLPPTVDEVERAESIVHDALFAAAKPMDGHWTMVGAAGTIRALALLVAAEVGGASAGQGSTRLNRSTVRDWRHRLLGLDFDQTLALNPAVLKGRADVMAAGVLVLDLIMEYLMEGQCIVSPWGLRHGMAIRYARRRAGVDS